MIVRPLALAPALLAAAAACACGPKRVETATARGSQDIVVLLKDDNGSVGRAIASNPQGSVDLTRERDAVRVSAGAAPMPPSTMTEADVQKIFGAALSAMPVAPRRFTLTFKFQSNELTDEAHSLLPEILTVVATRRSPDVVIIGHTDRSGTVPANYELGLRRATAVRNLLVAAGLDPSLVEVTSLGETDPLVPTPDGTPEPRNRRVDITVR